MKMVEALIKTFKLGDVQKALSDVGIHGMTLLEVKGLGKQKGEAQQYRGATQVIEYVPRVKIEIVATDQDTEKVIGAIIAASKTNTLGDGKIFVREIDDGIRIRTGESGDRALG